MLSAADLARMAAEMAAIRADNEVSITLVRAGSPLSAQSVRIERTGSGSGNRVTRPGMEETRSGVVIAGSTTLDIQKDDRFSYGGLDYRVTFVRPNRQVDTQAEAELLQ